MSRSKPQIKPHDVQGAKFIKQMLDLLRPLHAHRPDPKRTLHYDELCVFLLLYFFSPTLTSLRALQQASELERVRAKLGLPRFSLGSFSEAGAVFDPALLVPIMERLGQQAQDLPADGFLTGLDRRPTAVDGTLLHALPKMVWALWLDEHHRAAKLHLQLDLLKGVPLAASVTEGQGRETRQLRENLRPGRLYLEDRGYFDYTLLAAILAADSSFLTRVHDNIAYAPLGASRPLSAAALKAGVELDQLVRAGSPRNRDTIERPLRLVRIKVPDAPAPPGGRKPNRVDTKTKLFRTRQTDHTLTLLTDLVELDAELIGTLYRYRWQIELFFRWFKRVLQADRPLALSQNGLTIVVYCALIASMLVVLWTGRKPTRRTYELLCFYFAGWVSDAELVRHLERLAPAEKTR